MSFRILRTPRSTLAAVMALCRHEINEQAILRTVLVALFLLSPTLKIIGPAGQSLVYADTQFAHSITASQSYDSNVWGGPKEFVPAGKRQGDLVSSIAPSIQLLTKNRQMDTVLSAGVAGNLYVYNPQLDFVSVNASLFSNLDGWINQFIEGAKLKVANSFVYTPQPPSFLTGGQPPPTADLLLRGIQGARANTYLNNGSVTGSYVFGKGLGVQAAYYLGIMKFGQIFVQPTQSTAIPVAYFDTIYHSFSIGPTYLLSPSDTISLNYEPSLNYLSGPTSDQNFTTHTVTAQYVRSTTYWTATLRGGATRVSTGDDMFFSGGLTVTGNLVPSTRVRATISRKVAPAFYAAGGAALTDTYGLYIDHKISRLLTLSVGGSYGKGTTVPVEFLDFTSYQGSAILRYQLTRLISTSLSYDYFYYRYESPSIGEIPASGYSFPRNLVTLSLTATWR
jgi:hypothetical protein